LAAVSGGCSPQSSSIRRSLATNSFARSARIARQLALSAAADDERPIALSQMGRVDGAPWRALPRRYHATPRPSLPGSYPSLPAQGGLLGRLAGKTQQTGSGREGRHPMITLRQQPIRLARRRSRRRRHARTHPAANRGQDRRADRAQSQARRALVIQIDDHPGVG
jgi:hypothetical protein